MSPEQQQTIANAEDERRPSATGVRPRKSCEPSQAPGRATDVVAFKFGGSSLAGAERMRQAASLVRQAAESRAIVVVVSAMKGVTDRLLHVGQLLALTRSQAARTEALAIIELHLAVLRDLNLPREDHEQVAHELELLSRDLLHETPSFGHVAVNCATYDRLASFGERFAARLFAAALLATAVTAVPVASSDFVVTCETFREARPDLEFTRNRGRQVLLPLLLAGIVPVITGFIGATPDGRITTLGRNSSDYSGALIAHVVDATELVIWTDVDGVYTANPKESDQAKLLNELSYGQALALAANGAKVLHPHVLPLAAQSGMTVWIRNSFKPQARGTRIAAQTNGGAA
jgi:bifunctional aspartokinase / homoserine dehydrogenase 1